jgi:chromosome segregation protein
MKLDFIEISGFRGFKDKFRLDFGRGFTVVSGRNGVGKSTIFDAIEFALTGEVDKYRIEKAARETLHDYLWWRGSGQASAHYVSVGFVDDSDKPFVVTRTREAGVNKEPADIEAALCAPAKPDQALRQLCRTSIIRDEWIAALSLDLSETERFDLVRTALGAIEGPGYASKAREVVVAAEGNVQRAQRRYDDERLQLNSALVQLSESRDRASKAGDVAAAMALLDAQIGPTPADLVERIATARDLLAKGRMQLAGWGEAIRETYEISRLGAEFEAPLYRQAKETAERAVEEARALDATARQTVNQTTSALVKEQEADTLATSLAALVDHGARLGLDDGHCPLCAAERTDLQFEVGLSLAKARVAGLGAGVAAARQLLDQTQKVAKVAAETFVRAQTTLNDLLAKENALRTRQAAHIEQFTRLGVDFKFTRDPEGLERAHEAERERLIGLERAILTLEASQAVELVTSTEVRVTSIRESVGVAENALARAQAAAAAAKNIEHSVSRTSAEIVDERLALISPLLNELYVRLRPHNEWRSIQYSIRGDVRRFLSLKVGDGLNPQFVFSSGQRRAAGLAFLLSVHLSRAWSRWRTLLLDDPVQHIDDFRALHLVEVLAAVRLDQRQIACAVEDPDLADLLCRRLISTREAPGMRFDVGYGPDGNIAIVKETQILPVEIDALRGGPEVKLAV